MSKSTTKRTTTATPFAFGCDVSVFPVNELKALERQGPRLEALATGAARPASAQEEHFLQVDRDEAEPASVVEKAWVRLKGRREYEREQAREASAPPAPAENYGMVEFDADRCWW